MTTPITYSVDPLDLTTIDDVASYMNVDLTKTLANGDTVANLMQRLVTQASIFIQTQLNRIFMEQAYTEVRNGTGTDRMLVRDYPLISFSSVAINDISVPQVTDLTSFGYNFDAVTVYLRGYRFTRGIQNVRLIYTAGYSTIPFDIAQCTIDLCARKFKERERIGVNSKVIEGQQINFQKTDLTDEFKSLMRQYIKVSPL